MQPARELKDTFDEVAALYDASRPGYPAALYTALARAADLERGDWALEVGCGSGQATGGLLELGLQVTALDPGPALIRHAKRRFAGATGVDFVVSPFEAWAPPPALYRLVASAQAWHWIPQDLAFAKAAEALEPGGLLAVFGNAPSPLPTRVLAALEPIFARHAPELWAPPPESWYLPEGPVADLFAGSGLFEPATYQAFPWTWRKTVAQHIDFLRSRSDYQVIPADRREALLAEIAPVLGAGGEALALGYGAHLYSARRKR